MPGSSDLPVPKEMLLEAPWSREQTVQLVAPNPYSCAENAPPGLKVGLKLGLEPGLKLGKDPLHTYVRSHDGPAPAAERAIASPWAAA